MDNNSIDKDGKTYAAGFAAGKAAGVAAASEIVTSQHGSAVSASENTNPGDEKTGSGTTKREYVTGFAAGISAALAATSTAALNHPAPVDEPFADDGQDLDHLDQPGNAWIPTPADNQAGEVASESPAVSDEDLGHIMPGCFVQVGSGESSYWVEIGQIDGVTISGIVHPELSGTLCVINHDSCEIARFNRNQITALGCDRYCFC